MAKNIYYDEKNTNRPWSVGVTCHTIRYSQSFKTKEEAIYARDKFLSVNDRKLIPTKNEGVFTTWDNKFIVKVEVFKRCETLRQAKITAKKLLEYSDE